MTTQEEAIELFLFKKAIKESQLFYWKLWTTDWEYDKYAWHFVYRDGEIRFNPYDNTAKIYHYVDGHYNLVSKLVKKDESLQEFLLRSMELNEKIWETLRFESN